MLAKIQVEFFVSFPNSEPGQAIMDRVLAKLRSMNDYHERLAYLEAWRVRDPGFVPVINIFKDPV